MKIEINENEWLLLKAALQDYYYICKDDEDDSKRLDKILTLEEKLNEQYKDDEGDK